MTTLPLSPTVSTPEADRLLLDVRDLMTEFKTRGGLLCAVSEVSFSLASGRVLAVLGEPGSGKSVMLRTILGIQARGARISGEVVLRGDGISMVFQNPMTALDPVFTVEQQIVETLRRGCWSCCATCNDG